MPTDDLLGTIALDALGTFVPSGYKTLGVEHKDRIILDAVDQAAKPFFVVCKRRNFGLVRTSLSPAFDHSSTSGPFLAGVAACDLEPNWDDVASFESQAGSSTWKIAPPPGASQKLTSPPRRVTICFTMLSPRPVPPCCRASVALACANFSKM